MVTTPRQPQRKAQRRDQILATARDRFAADGIGAVTMGDIAATAGVSPGNLYYWFRQKSDVVNALFDEWSIASQPAVTPADPPEDLLAFFWDREDLQQRVTARYDFFARDLLPLLHSDPDLRARYRVGWMTSELGGPWTDIVDPDGDPVRHMRALLSLALTPTGRNYLESRS
jgi:TetR/AcrR family transcriptional repressor of uid operon